MHYPTTNMYSLNSVLINRSIPVPFNSIRARSFHKKPTHIQPATPIILSIKSYICKPSIPLILIDARINIDAIHFTYHDRSCLGVLLLYIRRLFSSSSRVNSSPCAVFTVTLSSSIIIRLYRSEVTASVGTVGSPTTPLIDPNVCSMCFATSCGLNTSSSLL